MAFKGAVPKPITVISYAPLLSLPLLTERQKSGESSQVNIRVQYHKDDLVVRQQEFVQIL